MFLFFSTSETWSATASAGMTIRLQATVAVGNRSRDAWPLCRNDREQQAARTQHVVIDAVQDRIAATKMIRNVLSMLIAPRTPV